MRVISKGQRNNTTTFHSKTTLQITRQTIGSDTLENDNSENTDKKKLYPEIIFFSDWDHLIKDSQISREKENYSQKRKISFLTKEKENKFFLYDWDHLVIDSQTSRQRKSSHLQVRQYTEEEGKPLFSDRDHQTEDPQNIKTKERHLPHTISLSRKKKKTKPFKKRGEIKFSLWSRSSN